MNWRTLYGRKGRASEGIIRSLGPAAWFQPGVGVTGTLTASNWADQSGNGRDLAQGTAGNQPIYLPHTGTDYAYLPGVTGNYFSTPDSAAAGITGDIDVRVYAALNNWNTGDYQDLIGKCQDANKRSYWLGADNSGKFAFSYGTDGTSFLTLTSSVVHGLTAGQLTWVRITRNATTGVGKFYLSTDGSTWTQLGADVAGSDGAMFDSVSAVEVGAIFAGAGELPAGKLYRAQIYNGINGTLAVDFDPSRFAETSTNGATAVASTGETWTLNSTGEKPTNIVKSSQLLLTTTGLQYMSATYAPSDPQTLYMVIKQNAWTANHGFWSSGAAGVDGMNVTQQTATPRIGLYAGSSACENSGAAIGSYAVGCFLFNGAGSLVQINAGTATTGNPGTTSGTFVNLSREAVGACFQVKEVLIFAAAHNASQRALVQNYLAARHGIVL